MKNKRGIEPIIATVLLIVIVIAAAALVWTVVIPFIKQQTESSQACLNTVGLTIDRTETCWDSTEKYLQVKVVRDSKEFELTAIYFKVTDREGNVETKEWKVGPEYIVHGWDPEQYPDGRPFELPDILEDKFYKFTLIEDLGFESEDVELVSISIAPVVKSGASEKTCDVTSEIPVDSCLP